MAFGKKKNTPAPELDDAQLMDLDENLGLDGDIDNLPGELENGVENEIDFEADVFDNGLGWSEDELASAKVAEKEERKPYGTIIGGLLALIAALIVFLWMLTSWASVRNNTEAALRNQNATTMIVVANTDLEAYTEITAPVLAQKFTSVKVYKDSVPHNAILWDDWEDLLGLTTKHKIVAGAPITIEDLEKFSTKVKEGQATVVLPIGGLVTKNGGDIKAGDLVEVGVIRSDEYSTYYETILDEVAVYQFLDEAGNAQQTAATAAMIKVVVDYDDAITLYEESAKGINIILTKLLQDGRAN